MTCHTQPRQDVVFHILYGGNSAYISSLIEECVVNIAAEYPSEGVRESLQSLRPNAWDSPDRLCVKFFVLLNEDEKMRTNFSNVKSSIMASLCHHKAERFYDELNDFVLPAWIKDERIDLNKMVDMLREVYLHS